MHHDEADQQKEWTDSHTPTPTQTGRMEQTPQSTTQICHPTTNTEPRSEFVTADHTWSQATFTKPSTIPSPRVQPNMSSSPHHQSPRRCLSPSIIPTDHGQPAPFTTCQQSPCTIPSPTDLVFSNNGPYLQQTMSQSTTTGLSTSVGSTAKRFFQAGRRFPIKAENHSTQEFTARVLAFVALEENEQTWFADLQEFIDGVAPLIQIYLHPAAYRMANNNGLSHSRYCLGGAIDMLNILIEKEIENWDARTPHSGLTPHVPDPYRFFTDFRSSP
jgi:hypothetical protein